MLFENVTKKVKVKLSFGHKAVISSLSKLDIKSNKTQVESVQLGKTLDSNL